MQKTYDVWKSPQLWTLDRLRSRSRSASQGFVKAGRVTVRDGMWSALLRT